MSLMCPVCQSALSHVASQWQCAHGHHYDIAKQGYVNLHLVQHKHSKNPGDTPERVQARRRFLSAGYYQPLLQQIQQIVQDLSINTLVDIGCGEGYYTQGLADVTQRVIAVDIAKNAVQLAAKNDREKRIDWVVATGAVLPILPTSVDLCCSFFSPLPKQEMQRILTEQGYVLFATPDERHLYSVRAKLFEQVHLHQPDKFIQQLQPEFELLRTWQIKSDLLLDQMALQDLIGMTPYAYKAKPEQIMALQQQTQFQTCAEFKLFLLQKRS